MNTTPDRPVLPWRLVAGAWVHFAVPTYLVVLLFAFLFGRLAWKTPDGAARLAASASIRFVVIYGALAIFTAVGARLLEPFLRRRRTRLAARDPLAGFWKSERGVRDALSQIETFSTSGPGSRLPSVLKSASGITWDHADPRVQRLSADLAEAVRVFAAALSSAAPDAQRDVVDMACESIAQVLEALHDLGNEQARLNQGDARAMASYIGSRYGKKAPSDLSGRLHGEGVN